MPSDALWSCSTYFEQQTSKPLWHDPDTVKVGGHTEARQKFPWLLHSTVSGKIGSAEPVGRGKGKNIHFQPKLIMDKYAINHVLHFRKTSPMSTDVLGPTNYGAPSQHHHILSAGWWVLSSSYAHTSAYKALSFFVEFIFFSPGAAWKRRKTAKSR